MKLSIDRLTLKAALAICRRYVPSKNASFPHLRHVLFYPGPADGVYVSAADLENTVRFYLGGLCMAEIGNTARFAVALPIEDLQHFVSKGAGEAVLIQADRENRDGEKGEENPCTTATIEIGGARVDLETRNPSLLPHPEVACRIPEQAKRVEWTKDAVRELSRVAHAMSIDETRYNLNCVFVEDRDGYPLWTATDGHRLAQMQSATAAESFDGERFPAAIVLEMERLAKRKKPLCDGSAEKGFTVALCGCHARRDPRMDPGNLEWRHERAVMRYGPVTVAARFPDAAFSFPDYRQVIPTSNGLAVKVDRESLAEMAGRIGPLSTGSFSTGGVKMLVNARLEIHALGGEVNASESIGVGYDGPALEVGVSSRYLREALESFSESHVRIRFAEGETEPDSRGKRHPNCQVSPMLIESESLRQVEVIMPLLLPDPQDT